MKYLMVLLLSAISFLPIQAQNNGKDDGDPFPTWKVDGSYKAGEAVVRNRKLGGSVGPFFSITGTNNGDPAHDPINWSYCCGTVTYGNPTVLLTGSTTNLLLPNTFLPSPWNPDSAGLGVDNPCVPLNGSIVLPASSSPENLVINGYGCASGGSGTLSTALSNTVTFTIDISPFPPNDGGFIQVGPYNQAQGGFGLVNWCFLYNSTSSTSCNITLSSPWLPGDHTGLMFAYIPGSNNLSSFTLRTATWSIDTVQ